MIPGVPMPGNISAALDTSQTGTFGGSSFGTSPINLGGASTGGGQNNWMMIALVALVLWFVLNRAK